jgi:dimethylhistidine N-methyltransferase
MPGFASSKTDPFPAGEAGAALREFAREVRAGLMQSPQKQLSCKYFYDDLGTALFDAITVLPEYGLTRADTRVIRSCAEPLMERLGRLSKVVELGSGTGAKTRWILKAAARRGPVDYYPIDISSAALDRCKQQLGKLRGVRITAIESGYLDGLSEAVSHRGTSDRILVLFLGSTIGNFEPPAARAFLSAVRQRLLRDDAVLIGTDLKKAVGRMLLAYDDPAGVTAAFNRNLLGRINRELGGDFDLSRWRHEARYNESTRSVEMHLVSEIRQCVRIRFAETTVPFARGESIWTEACHKFEPEEVADLAARTGFRCETQWIDSDWPFAESLLIAE